MKKFFILSILLLFALVLWAQDYDLDIDIDLTDSFGTEETTELPFSLYGYLVNFSTVNIYTNGMEIENSDMGNTLYIRLKGDFDPEDSLHFHFEAYYSGSIGKLLPSSLYEEYAIDHSLNPLELETELEDMKHRLWTARTGRVHPLKDILFPEQQPLQEVLSASVLRLNCQNPPWQIPEDPCFL